MVEQNLTGASANYDWGVYNAIFNGGNAPNQWRTLTDGEWHYLRSTRTGASSKYGIGQIQLANGSYIHGCIFLPDSWTLPTGCSFTAGVSSSSTDYTLNTYTLSQWSQMEAAGALFLPAAGYRFGSNVRNVSSYGYYWSSSFYSMSSPYYNSDYAYNIYFSADLVNEDGTFRYDGRSVRLVQDIN